MTILIIPGLLGHPGEVAFRAMGETLEQAGHTVIKLAWRCLSGNLAANVGNGLLQIHLVP